MKLAGIPAQVLGLLFVTRTIAYWRMDCPGIISEGRLDPIVTPGQISGHAHVTFGGNGFHPDMDYDSTQRSTCTTCTIKGDNSNYVSRPAPHSCKVSDAIAVDIFAILLCTEWHVLQSTHLRRRNLLSVRTINLEDYAI